MENHYDVLGIPKDASTTDIKRAYFGLVKKYSPERDPDKFQQIREAYDILSDKNARAQYDSISQLPGGSAEAFAQGEEAMRLANFPAAIELFERLVEHFPKTTLFSAKLAEAYFENGNTGKSTKLWTALCEKEPENAAYAGALARSMDERGWRIKAIEQYRRALSLDQDNVNLWMGLLHCLIDGDQAAEILETLDMLAPLSRERGFENAGLAHTMAFASLEYGHTEDILPYLRDVNRLEGEEPDEEFWMSILISLYHDEEYALTEEALRLAGPLTFPEGMLQEAYTRIRLGTEIHLMKNFPEELQDYLGVTMTNSDDPEDRFMRVMMKRYLVEENFGQYMAELRKNHPELYALDTDFFNALAIGRNLEKLVDKIHQEGRRLIKKYPHLLEDMKAGDEDEEYEDAPETFVREEPKVGRNDPCPCGSGKKYKKCHGA